MRKPRTPPDNFPYTDPRVPIMVFHNMVLLSACTLEEKINLVNAMETAQQGQIKSPIYAVWPGQSRSDVFILNVKTLKEVLTKAVQDAAAQPG